MEQKLLLHRFVRINAPLIQNKIYGNITLKKHVNIIEVSWLVDLTIIQIQSVFHAYFFFRNVLCDLFCKKLSNLNMHHVMD